MKSFMLITFLVLGRLQKSIVMLKSIQLRKNQKGGAQDDGRQLPQLFQLSVSVYLFCHNK